MGNKELFSGLSVEKILSDVKEQQGEKLHIWSMDEIDKLLAEEETPAPAETVTAIDTAPVKTVSTADTAPVKRAESVERAQTDFAVEKAEPAPEVLLHVEEEIKTPAPKNTFGGLKAAARRAAQLEAESAKADASEKTAPETESEEQPTPLLDGVLPQEEPETDTEIAEEPIPDTPLPGQISIEKTRVFNEVEAHAVHKADIPHHIGQPILRTTTGELDPIPQPKKPSAMETDTQRERFLNRPEQKLEKTIEHKALLESQPPKTIERPGVIVRKAPEQEVRADGLQAIPTLVRPEDELKAQRESETRVQAGTLKSAAYISAEEAENAPLDDQMMLEGFQNTEDPIEQIDEDEAERNLLVRRREKAKKFRLFPGLNAEETDEESEEVEEDIADADEMAKTRIQPDLSQEAEAFASDEEDAEPETTDGAQQKAKKSARKARKKARRTAQPVTVLREFYGPKDAHAVYGIYNSEKRGSVVRLIVFTVLTLAALCASLSVRLTGGFAWFNNNASVYSAVNLIFLIVAAVLALKPLKTAFAGLASRRIGAETGVLCALVFSLIQVGVSYVYPEQLTAIPLYTSVALFVLLLYYAGKTRKLKNDMENFLAVSENYDRFYAVGQIKDPQAAFEIGRGLLLGEPDVRYSKRISFPAHFVEISAKNDCTEEIYAPALPMVLIAAGVIGAVTCFTSGEVFAGVSAMCAVAIAALPMSAFLVTSSAMRSVNRKLAAEGALAASCEAAEDITAANAVVLDASDLFDTASCRLRGMKMYHKMRVDEALLYTAAMTIQSGGPLSSVFDGVILHKREMLPQVESLAYEERLGCSGWIYNQRVLAGNRDLLLKHNVDVPDRAEEQRFRKDGCEVIYLAVEGKIAALFVVEYSADERIRGYLQTLEKYGISILVRTSDPNVTEALVEQYFSLPHNLVKIISPVAGNMFRTLTEVPPQPADCTVLHNGRTPSFLRALLSAFVLEEKIKLSQILLYIGMGLSVILLAVLSFFTALTQAGTMEILIFELLWTGIVVLVPKVKKV